MNLPIAVVSRPFKLTVLWLCRFAYAAYRRNTNLIQVPTTVIGLIDASVSSKVAGNYGNYKNRLGAYRAPMHTFLDLTFLRTLPPAQIRNDFAELIQISTFSHLDTFNLWDMYYEELIDAGFGRTDGLSEEVSAAADKINREGIHEMLKPETPKPSRDWLGPSNRIWAYVSCSSIQKFRGY